MSAELIDDNPAWEYPGGACRLLVWEGDGFHLAILAQDETGGDGTSVTNAMDAIIPVLNEDYPWVAIVQDTISDGGHVFEDVEWPDGSPAWFETSAEQIAGDLEITVDDLLDLLES